MKKRLIVICASAVSHQIGDKFAKSLSSGNSFDKEEHYYITSLSWVNQLGFVPAFANSPQNVVLWAIDGPPYWRKTVYPPYKADRIRSRKYDPGDVLQYLPRLKFPCLSVQGYEADDIAALAVSYFHMNRDIFSECFLFTNDCDWLGLVSENVTWLGTCGTHLPRRRGVKEAYEWLVKDYGKAAKYKQRLWKLPDFYQFDPTDIWRWKAVTGDSDNLHPDNYPDLLPLIDLFNPLAGHCLARNEEVIRRLKSQLKMALEFKPKVMTEDLEKAIELTSVPRPFAYITEVF